MFFLHSGITMPQKQKQQQRVGFWKTKLFGVKSFWMNFILNFVLSLSLWVAQIRGHSWTQGSQIQSHLGRIWKKTVSVGHCLKLTGFFGLECRKSITLFLIQPTFNTFVVYWEYLVKYTRKWSKKLTNFVANDWKN